MSAQAWQYLYLLGAVVGLCMAIKRAVFDDDALSGLGFCIISFSLLVASTGVSA